MKRPAHTTLPQPANKYRSFESFVQSHDPVYLQHAIQGRSIDFDKGIERLKHSGRAGLFVAARLLLEKAWHSPDIMKAAELIEHSKCNYERVIAEKVSPYIDMQQASALIHLAQMPLYAAIISSGRLPKKDIAQQSYAKTLEIGMVLVDEYPQTLQDRRHDRPGAMKALAELRGIISEVSVLALGQRFALQADISHEWFPLLSQFSADHSTRRRAQTTSAYDIDIFMQLEDQPIESMYQLQVKTQDKQYNPSKPAYANVSIVNLFPDLIPHNRHPGQLSVILEECAREEFNQDFAAARSLDFRSSRLLEVIEQHD